MTDTFMADAPQIPDVTAAEPIPASAMSEVNRILGNGDLYRYTTADSPVTQLEREFAAIELDRVDVAFDLCRPVKNIFPVGPGGRGGGYGSRDGRAQELASIHDYPLSVNRVCFCSFL